MTLLACTVNRIEPLTDDPGDTVIFHVTSGGQETRLYVLSPPSDVALYEGCRIQVGKKGMFMQGKLFAERVSILCFRWKPNDAYKNTEFVKALTKSMAGPEPRPYPMGAD